MGSLNQRARATAGQVRIHHGIGLGRRRRRMPKPGQPDLLGDEYAAALVRVAQLARAALAPLLAELPQILAGAAAARRHDAGEADRVAALIAQARKSLGEALKTADVEALAAKFARATTTFQKIQLQKQLRAGLGADVLLHDAKLRALWDGFIAENAALIVDVPQTIITQVAGIVNRGVQGARPHEQIAQEIQDRIGIGEDRAARIARDQVGKIYGQVNAQRQTELGITEFIWRTSGDERVREEHAARDGETFSYDAPPEDDGFGPVLPGEAINCRCFAEPVLAEILDAAE